MQSHQARLADRLESEVCQVASVRLDAGFPEDGLLSALEARKVGYVARIKKNERLKDLAAPFLQSLAPCLGPEPSLAFHELSYQASSWTAARRIVLVLQQSEGDLFPEFSQRLSGQPLRAPPDRLEPASEGDDSSAQTSGSSPFPRESPQQGIRGRWALAAHR